MFAMSPPAKTYVLFAADVRPDIPVTGGKLKLLGTPMWSYLTFSPHLHLRMYATDSSPVRPVSFMPRADWYNLRKLGNPESSTWGGVQLTVGHHSNGQDGCTLTNQEAEFDLSTGRRISDCVERADLEPELNHLNGTFGLNFVRLSLPLYVQNLAGLTAVVRSTHFASVSFDPGQFSVDTDTERFYPSKRVGLEYLYEARLDEELNESLCSILGGYLCSAARVGGARLEAAYRYDVNDDRFFPGSFSKDQFSVEGEVWIADESMGLGLFIGGYIGRDHYNIAYDERIAIAQLGVIWRHRGLANMNELGKP